MFGHDKKTEKKTANKAAVEESKDASQRSLQRDPEERTRPESTNNAKDYQRVIPHGQPIS